MPFLKKFCRNKFLKYRLILSFCFIYLIINIVNYIDFQKLILGINDKWNSEIYHEVSQSKENNYATQLSNDFTEPIYTSVLIVQSEKSSTKLIKTFENIFFST